MIRTFDRCDRGRAFGLRRCLFVVGTGAPVPSPLGITSPLGMAPGSSVPPAGIPMGATELASPGLSPAPAATIGMTGNSTTCPAMGSSSPGISGSGTTFDGGGPGAGTGTLPAGAATSGTCGTSSSSSASSSAATSPISPGGTARVGIPLGSVEIGNAGVSPLLVVPTPSHPLDDGKRHAMFDNRIFPVFIFHVFDWLLNSNYIGEHQCNEKSLFPPSG